MKRISSLPVIVPVILIIFLSSGKELSRSAAGTYKDHQFTGYFRRETGWIAGDGAFSIPVNEDLSIWTYGDSFIDCYDTLSQTVPCLFQARNAAVLVNISNPDNQITLRNRKGPATFFTYGTDNKYWFWPTSGYQYDDTVYVFMSRIRSTGEPGMWGFEGVDTNYIAKIGLSDPGKTYFSILPPHGGINFGLSVIKGEEGYNYVFGIRSNNLGNDLFVARFRSGNIYGAWEYYSGDGWTNDIKQISRIYSEFTASFYICKLRNTYVLITTEFSVSCDQGKNIYVSVSDNPAGPFTGKHSVWEVDDTLEGHYPFFYIANAHPEFDNGREELLITYCINGYGDCIETCKDNRMDPDVYRPKAIRVPYKIINENL